MRLDLDTPFQHETASALSYTVTIKTVDEIIDKFIFTYMPNAPKAAVEQLKADLNKL